MALLGNLKGSAQAFQDTEFYNGIATQSLRFDDGSAAKLEKTPSASNRKTHTLSMWIKRCELGGGSVNNSLFRANGSGDTGRTDIWFDANDKLNVAGSSTYFRITNRRFRDVGSWYHIVFAFDTTDGTADNRLKIYVNGVQETSFATNNAYSQNTDYGINGNVAHQIGTGYDHFDGYMAEVNFVDGTQYDASFFGETKNGVWIPKPPSVTYGTNGYRLQFKQTGTGTASASTIGADTSGNDNHYTSTNLVASDSNMPDSPENNFATLNSLTAPGGSLEYLKGNLKITRGSVDAYSLAMSTLAVKTGKWYAELRPQGTITANNHMVGVCITNVKDQSSGDPYLENGQINYVAFGNGHVDDGGSINASTFSGSTSFGAGDIIGVALDLDSGTRTVKFYKNNSLVNTSSYGNLSSEFDNEDIGFMSILFGTNTCVWNFGQDSTFAGQISAGGNADGNGIGDFAYSPPSGYLALCSANLPEPTIGPNSATQADDHFNTVLWTGNGSNSHGITSVGFKPDWVWIKERGNASSNYLIDSSRGLGTGDSFRALLSDNTDSEYTSLNDQLRTLDSDGFTLDDNTDTNFYVNRNNQTYVAWNWKANGGTTSSNTDGSITSTVQANTTAGFSIVLYTGTGSSETKIGHGLGAVPDVVLVRRRDSAGSWQTYLTELSTSTLPEVNGRLHLEGTNAALFDSYTLEITSTVVEPTLLASTHTYWNASSGTYLMYCFKGVEGYSKFGSYNGNGNADGPFVFTGFRPAWVLIKNTARSADWRLHDIARQPTNDGGGHILLPSSNSAEVTSEYDIDFLSNGFKLRSGDVYENGDGELLIYLAFAEDPFKYANAK